MLDTLLTVLRLIATGAGWWLAAGALILLGMWLQRQFDRAMEAPEETPPRLERFGVIDKARWN